MINDGQVSHAERPIDYSIRIDLIIRSSMSLNCLDLLPNEFLIIFHRRPPAILHICKLIWHIYYLCGLEGVYCSDLFRLRHAKSISVYIYICSKIIQ